MEQKRDREQQMRRDKRSKDSKRGRSNKIDGKSSAPWRTGEVIEREGMAESASSSTSKDVDSTNGKETGADFSRRQIDSNWSKYETTLPSYENVSKASNFESLMSTPISGGSHFKFKSEQSWEAYSPSQFSKLFTLDLHMLSTSLSTIPFYEQLNLSKDLFNEEELKRMDNEADENHAKYADMSSKEAVETVSTAVPKKSSSTSSDRIVKSPQSNSIVEGVIDLTQSSSANSIVSANPDYIQQSTMVTEELLNLEEDDELDFLLALKEPIELPVALTKPPTDLAGNQQVSKETKLLVPSTSSEAKQEDLDDWLDSILDD